MKKVTSQDVAARAGVSQSAVSLILNESDKVLFNEETKQREKDGDVGMKKPENGDE